MRKRSAGSTKNGKKGSYLVEAALVVPIFILSMMLLANIIPVIARCENITYGAAEEMRMEMAKSAFRSDMPALPLLASARVRKENTNVSSFLITKYKYRCTEGKTNDILCLGYTCLFNQPDPFGVFNRIRFQGRIKARAYTGTYYDGQKESGELVCVFPENGRCYHSRNCTHVIANCRQVYLTDAIRKIYRPCPNCDSSSAKNGTPVFCFDSYGRAYHLSGCRAVKRYYIEIDKKEAIDSGYVPCSKCRGGDNGSN